tara:strand:+ start:80 stop:442 length:363 start_codon:yes stop_codon:yes gene_type:complete
VNENNQKYKTIGEVANILNLKKKDGKPNTHTIRFWEKQFTFVKPKIFNSRRYYNIETIEILKKIKFLLKEKGMTLKGVKNQINLDKTLVDENNISNINKSVKIKLKLKKISKLIKQLKKY